MKIAFAGKFYCGKSTVARYADEVYGITRWALGDYVRSELIDDRTFTKAQVYAARKTDAVREGLQLRGEGRRSSDPDYWIDKLVDDLCLFKQEDVCIDDMRYENEAEVLRKMGFKLVYVECTNLKNEGDPKRDHASEHGLDEWYEWDGLLVADYGHPESLYDQLDELIKRWQR